MSSFSGFVPQSTLPSFITFPCKSDPFTHCRSQSSPTSDVLNICCCRMHSIAVASIVFAVARAALFAQVYSLAHSQDGVDVVIPAGNDLVQRNENNEGDLLMRELANLFPRNFKERSGRGDQAVVHLAPPTIGAGSAEAFFFNGHDDLLKRHVRPCYARGARPQGPRTPKSKPVNLFGGFTSISPSEDKQAVVHPPEEPILQSGKPSMVECKIKLDIHSAVEPFSGGHDDLLAYDVKTRCRRGARPKGPRISKVKPVNPFKDITSTFTGKN
ncbi:hypothetical protein K439DRAFT_272929 [Ramaria rubella]|nr:hypothetical protein K439DRAFT_272929 [Ramaria rubella]